MKTKLFALILALMTVMTSLSTGAVVMVGTVTTTEEICEEQLPLEAEQAFVAVQEENIYQMYGTKIFHEDFSDFSDGTALVAKTDDADGYTGLDGGKAHIATFSGNAKGAMSVATVDGNKLVKVDVPTSKNGQLFYIYVNMPDLTFSAGKYYALSRYYFVPDTLTRMDTVYDTSFTATGAGETGTTVSSWYPNTAKDNSWTINVKTVEVTESNKSSMKQYAFFNTRPYTTNGGYYYLDDLAVYFKPLRTASYNLDGGTGTFDSFTYYDYEAVTLPSDAPAKTGYTFEGWMASTSGKTYAAGETVSAEEIGNAQDNLTLTAVWKKLELGTYNESYGEVIFSDSFEGYDEGSVISGSPEYVSEGTIITYTNGGEYTVAAYNGSKMMKFTPVTAGSWKDIGNWLRINASLRVDGKYVVYGEWYAPEGVANATAVNLIGGNAPQNVAGTNEAHSTNNSTVKAGSTSPATYAWVFNLSGSSSHLQYGLNTSSSATVISPYYLDNIALYFKPLRSAVYNLDGGEGDIAELQYYDFEAVTISDTAPEKDGYIFKGWMLNLDGKVYEPGAVLSADVIGRADEDLTLTAVWDEIIIRSYNEAYGESIFYDNFEKTELGSTITGAPCYVADGYTVKYVDNASITIAEYKGSKMAKFEKTDAQVTWWGGPHLSIDVNLGTTGKYTVTADYYAPEGCSATTDARITLNGAADSASVMQYVGSFNYAYSFVPGENKQRMAYVAGIHPEATENNKIFHIDNIELFYKPTRTAVFDADGGEGTAPVLTYYDYESLTLPENTFTKQDYVFYGWKSSLDGEVYKAGEVIDASSIGKADEALTLTAVWHHTILPTSYSENSIRVDDPSGIRFKASVRKETKESESTTEYGFLATRASLLGSQSAEYLTFEQSDVRFVSGISYRNDGVAENYTDKVFATDGDSIIFTAVIYGILETKEAYEEEIVVRPYIKYNGETLYGEPMSRSIVSVAKAIRDGGYYGLDEYSRQSVEGILEICGESL